MPGIIPQGQGGRPIPTKKRYNGVPGSKSVPKAFQPAGRLGNAVQGKDANALHLNVLGLQHFLRNKGYDVTVDGKLGPVTKQALRDAIQSGVITHASAAQMNAVKGVKGGDIGPKAFDRMIGNAGKPPFPQHVIGKNGSGVLTGSGSLDPSKGGGGSAGGQAINTGPTSKAIKAATGAKIPVSDANFGQLFNVDNTAQNMAQEQFQPQINEQQLTVNQDPVQAAQNEKDVADWYNQVTDAQKAAGTQDAAATKAGVDSTNAATQALVQSLGGSANQGAGEAAVAGQNGANTLQAMGQAQAGLDSELAPILAAQAAQQKTNQANLDQQKLSSDQTALQSLQGQEGNAQVGAQMQLQSANNSLDQARQAALENIMQYNNSLSEQKFQNQLGLLTTETAAAMNGVTMAKNQAEANYYQAHGNLYNAEARNGGTSGGSGRSASQLNDIQRSLLGALGSKGLIVSPSSGVYKLAPGVTPQQVMQFGRQFDAGYGSLPGSFLPSALSGIQGY